MAYKVNYAGGNRAAPPGHRSAGETDRQAAADNARTQMLARYAARQQPDHVALQAAADQRAARDAIQRAEREAQRQAEAARLAAIVAGRVAEAQRAAAAIVAAEVEAQRQSDELRDLAKARAADQKAARDRRYAARRARQKR